MLQGNCQKLREVYFPVRLIVAKMGEINPAFRLGPSRHPSVAGSLMEGTRCFFLNELDVHISLNKVLRNKFYFDTEAQKLKATENLREVDHMQKYVNKEGIFKPECFFLDFIECMEYAISKSDLSQGFRIGDKHHNFTMMPLTLDYTPCLRCIDVDEHQPEARRCRHRVDCAAHHQKGLPECQNGCLGICNFFSHQRTCSCKEFTSPSVSISKIGVVLHVAFPDGTIVDCDVNVPTIPTSTPYHGGVKDLKDYLSRTRPVGWVDECSKAVDMASDYSPQQQEIVERWDGKMKRINRDTVLSRQVLS